LFGNLHSLIQIPPLSALATTQYGFYHKTLFDFLEHLGRCEELYFRESEVWEFLWDSFNRACTSEFVLPCPFRGIHLTLYDFAGGADTATSPSSSESFLRLLVSIPDSTDLLKFNASSLPTPSGICWWASLTDAHGQRDPPRRMFQEIHKLVGVLFYLFQTLN
jgi:hypothetical protein